ncbi:MAG: aminoacyl-tRNA hydrolase [Oscillospiraceae bacterium]
MFNKTSTNSVEFIIVGLGNPDKKYEKTRHNTGFMAVDELASELNIKIDKIKYKALIQTCEIGSHKCLLMKPSTYMNNSGEAVVMAMNFYKIPIQNVIVIYDDISLDVSKIRIRLKGSAGGHNGIKSIISLTGKDDFPRIKIGVGKKPHQDYDLADWVLSNFTKTELELLKETNKNILEIITYILNDDAQGAMNKYNS